MCVCVCVFADGLVSFLHAQVFAHALVMMERRARQCHKGIVGAVVPPGYVSPRWDQLLLTRSDFIEGRCYPPFLSIFKSDI